MRGQICITDFLADATMTTSLLQALGQEQRGKRKFRSTPCTSLVVFHGSNKWYALGAQSGTLRLQCSVASSWAIQATKEANATTEEG
eukprot:4960337-Pyramimonas_sp.AAC.1